jgi:thiamine-monophosphate kinase
MAEKRSEISELGEFGLIERISREIELHQSSSLKGIGDDAAVIGTAEELTLLSTDLLLEGVHFDLGYMPLQHLGYKAVAVNVSDIAAMNGIPTQVVIGLGLSNRFSVEAIDALYEGIRQACKNYLVDLVGGDTSTSHSGLIISVSILGKVDKKKIAYRSGARLHDILCVTGDLGAAYMGLQVLEREKQVFMANQEVQPDIQKYDYIVGRQLKPEARMDIVYELGDLNLVPTSMIDVSDGLASEVFHLSRNSNVGFKLFEDKIPIDNMAYDTALEFNLDPIVTALNGGEDYELLFTIGQSDFEKVKNHPDIHFIGHAYEGENVLLSKAGTVVPLRAQGWDHLR